LTKSQEVSEKYCEGKLLFLISHVRLYQCFVDCCGPCFACFKDFAAY